MAQKFSRELIKGSTKNLILAVIAEEELYGYQIVKSLRKKSNEAFEFGEGSVYPALHSLEKSGYLKSKWVPQEQGANRKYYSLTKKGAKELKKAMAEWKEFSTAVDTVFKGVDLYA